MSALPYPHARNDCGMCRERDADFHVLGEDWNRPDTGWQLLLCQACFGRWLVTPVYVLADGQPVTIAVEAAPKRLADHGLTGGPPDRMCAACVQAAHTWRPDDTGCQCSCHSGRPKKEADR